MVNQIELLAPGGDVDAIKAAIVAGANAVYCGLPSFNARNRANNLSIADLKEVVMCAHGSHCRIYLTLNTIILEHELAEVVAVVKQTVEIGVDAVIVQDLGLLYIMNRYFPWVEVHASTQLTTHNIGQVDFLARMGIQQVNLARELSIEEIAVVTEHAHSRGIKTEVFVHGAFCVSFSGQCYMSCAISGHSGNRGACVQPCRREYIRVPESGGLHAHSGALLPFNLKDNNAFGEADKLIDAGVDSLKIEGRIKNFQYVYVTVSAWRAQIDRFIAHGSIEEDNPSLNKVFNRTFTSGYLDGHISKDMFIDTSRDQSLTLVGAVASYSADDRILRLDRHEELAAGTTVLLYTSDFTFICTGIIHEHSAQNSYKFTIEHKLKGKIVAGQKVYRLADTERMERIRKEIDALSVHKQAVSVVVSGREGELLEARFTTQDKSVTAASTSLLSRANAHALTIEQLTDKLGKLGETPFSLSAVTADNLEAGLFIPVKELNEIRRVAIKELMGVPPVFQEVVFPAPSSLSTHLSTLPLPSYLISAIQELPKDLDPKAQVFFELPVNCGDSLNQLVKLFHEHSHWIPWFPAILIGNDYTDAVRFLQSCNCKSIITDNTGIGFKAGKLGIPWIAGPLLNITNSFTCTCLSEYPFCKGAFVSQELDTQQINALVPPENFELWYNLSGPRFLMNTRQCIIRNVSGCKKDVMDQLCTTQCNRKATVHDSHRVAYHIVKRPGHYNQVYYGRKLDNTQNVKAISQLLAGVLVDCRRI